MYDSPEYKRTRWSYIAECTFEYFVALMVSDSILSLLLGNLGMSDSSIGIVSSLVSLAFLFQLLTVPVVRRITNTKVFGIIFHTVGQFAFAALFLVPLLPVGGRVGRVTGIHVGEAIRAIGGRLKATHINDNLHNGQDDHLFPYFGTVDWADAMRAFKETGYEGDFAYEAGSKRIPAADRDIWLAYTAALGRRLLALS